MQLKRIIARQNPLISSLTKALFIACASSILCVSEAHSQSFYRGTLRGNVLQRPFLRRALVIVCPRITGATTQNGLNPLDVVLVSGNPAVTPELGAIQFTTNTALLGGAARLDMAFVGYNRTGQRIMNIFPDGRIAATGLNTFTALPGFTRTRYRIYRGQVAFQFTPNFRGLRGRINLLGAGVTFSPGNQYNAIFNGTYGGRFNACPRPGL